MAKVTIEGPRTKDNVTQSMGMNVLEAAKWRINKIIDRYDSVCVAFSGGKDSLAVMHLLKQVYEERGLDRKVQAIFRDEELIPDHVIDFVDHYRQLPWVDLKWFCVPLKSSKFIFGKSIDYVQWDNKREWVRQKPEWAINDLSGTVYDQYTMDDKVAEYFNGKLCVMTGIRTTESLTRYRAVINKINETFVCATQTKRVNLGRPIYDWTEDDVFKFFYDYGIAYAPIYDMQSAAGHSLRVSTPLHAESAKTLDKWRELDPYFYERVLKVFPEVAIQAKYFNEIESLTSDAPEPTNWQELEMWIKESYEGEQIILAQKRFKEVMQFQKNPDVAHKYPFDYVWGKFKSGVIKCVFLPESN